MGTSLNRSHLRHAVMVVVLVLVAALATACFDPLNRAGSRDTDPNHISVGSGGVLEAQIIGQIYIDALEANGFVVTDQLNSGTRERYIPALRAGDIDLVPDFAGNLLQYLAANTPTISAQRAEQLSSVTSLPEITKAFPEVLGDDLAVLTPAPGSDADSVTVTSETAKRYGLKSIADLAELSKRQTVSFMANSEFATRSVGVPGLEKNYGLRVDFKPNNDSGGQATINELTSGRVTAADIYTTTPAIATENLVVLEDPKNNFPANNIVPLIAKSKATPKVSKVIDAVSSKMTVEELRDLNYAVSGPRKLEVEQAASEWVAKENLDRSFA
ncbi:ABC transporter substrate-binding protein [Williamsia maris]|nr:ABC transporter substrate-binding protein [Williamsia maris]